MLHTTISIKVDTRHQTPDYCNGITLRARITHSIPARSIEACLLMVSQVVFEVFPHTLDHFRTLEDVLLTIKGCQELISAVLKVSISFRLYLQPCFNGMFSTGYACGREILDHAAFHIGIGPTQMPALMHRRGFGKRLNMTKGCKGIEDRSKRNLKGSSIADNVSNLQKLLILETLCNHVIRLPFVSISD
jgi:hypothetical protein